MGYLRVWVIIECGLWQRWVMYVRDGCRAGENHCTFNTQWMDHVTRVKTETSWALAYHYCQLVYLECLNQALSPQELHLMYITHKLPVWNREGFKAHEIGHNFYGHFEGEMGCQSQINWLPSNLSKVSSRAKMKFETFSIVELTKGIDLQSTGYPSTGTKAKWYTVLQYHLLRFPEAGIIPQHSPELTCLCPDKNIQNTATWTVELRSISWKSLDVVIHIGNFASWCPEFEGNKW